MIAKNFRMRTMNTRLKQRFSSLAAIFLRAAGIPPNLPPPVNIIPLPLTGCKGEITGVVSFNEKHRPTLKRDNFRDYHKCIERYNPEDCHFRNKNAPAPIMERERCFVCVYLISRSCSDEFFFERNLKHNYKEVLLAKEVASFTGYCPHTVTSWVNEKKLRAIALPQTYVVPKEYLINFLVSDYYNKSIIKKSQKHFTVLWEIYNLSRSGK